ncbi:MAG: nucleotidyltransferase family protein [Thermoanaerobaculia bacterium]
MRWALLRAYGPLGRPFPRRFTADRVFSIAESLDLAARIAARTSRLALDAELGSESAERFRASRMATAAQSLALAIAARSVEVVAKSLAIPVAFLKFVALERSGLVAASSRAASDVDVLVPAKDAGRLQRELIRNGFTLSGSPGYEHQLPALISRDGAPIELHTMVLGVRLDGRRSASFESLARADLLLPASASGGSVPKPEVLLAHALVHGLAQHGAAPWAYPTLRVLSDVIDLGSASVTNGDGDDLARVLPWISRDVSRADLASITELRDRCLTGTYEDHELVRHAVAGISDEAYRRRLKVLGAGSSPSDGGLVVRAARSLVGAILLTRKQIDEVYGPPRSRWGYAARRIARPFDLAGRLVRYGLAAAAARLRSARLRS